MSALIKSQKRAPKLKRRRLYAHLSKHRQCDNSHTTHVYNTLIAVQTDYSNA